MDTILLKYQNLEKEYLIYDTNKNKAVMDAHAARTICSRNCGLGSAAIVAGPYLLSDGRYDLKMFTPEGEEKPLDPTARAAGLCYLKDAGYLQNAAPSPEETIHSKDNAASREDAWSPDYTGAKAIGKIFLSESFANTCFCLA